jgi:hypothetical protein
VCLCLLSSSIRYAGRKRPGTAESAESWWLMLVILAQEAEIRRIEVRSQPRQIV